MKTYSTTLLKVCIVLIYIPFVTLSIIGSIGLIKNPVSPVYQAMLYPIVIGMYLSTIPLYYCLYQAFRMLNFIDENVAFSNQSTEALKRIQYCAFSFSLIYVILLPFVYWLAQTDDAPGLVIMGMVPVFGAFIIGVFAAVLKRILEDAIKIKSENDLTV